MALPYWSILYTKLTDWTAGSQVQADLSRGTTIPQIFHCPSWDNFCSGLVPTPIEVWVKISWRVTWNGGQKRDEIIVASKTSRGSCWSPFDIAASTLCGLRPCMAVVHELSVTLNGRTGEELFVAIAGAAPRNATAPVVAGSAGAGKGARWLRPAAAAEALILELMRLESATSFNMISHPCILLSPNRSWFCHSKHLGKNFQECVEHNIKICTTCNLESIDPIPHHRKILSPKISAKKKISIVHINSDVLYHLDNKPCRRKEECFYWPWAVPACEYHGPYHSLTCSAASQPA